MKIALLYGGEIRADHSAKNAKAIYDDYAKSSPSCKVNMCKVDTDGYVYEEKIKSDIHRVLAFSDILIDTTYSYPKRAYHHSLAKKLNLKVFFAQEIDSHNHAKILEQVGISVNRHYLIKKEDKNHTGFVYDIWREIHLPIVIKSLKNFTPKLITYSPHETLEHIKFIHKRNDAAVISQYSGSKIYTVISIKNYRGQKIYNTPIVEIFKSRDHTNKSAKYTSARYLSDKDKDDIYKILDQAAEHVDAKLIRFDLSVQPRIKILNISIKPSYHEGGVVHGVLKDYSINISDTIQD